MARRSSANESFHDRYAGSYDDTYANSDYWRFYRTVTWNHMRPFLPRTQPARVLDLGCGTGEWGLKLMKSRFEVTFVDLSLGMLERARKKAEAEFGEGSATFLKADLSDLGELETGAYAFATAQGDPLSMCADRRRAFRGIARALEPGGVLVASVDHRAAQFEALFEVGDWDGLEPMLLRGETEFLTRNAKERFPVHAYDLEELEKLLAKTGFELVDVIGKTILPVRRYPAWLADKAKFQKLVQFEERLHRRRAWLARASHLQFVARRT
ncbi:MAG: methyltransferase domain-containing protein [Planctomycetes bacterium]|nr:methyltransferase domain-containing protein [Planctomycetota bacterium]